MLALFEIAVPLLHSILAIIVSGVPLTLIRRERGGGAVSRDILLYISFIAYWVGPPFFLKTSYQDPLFYFSHKHTVCHFRPFTKSDFVGRTDLWINLRIEVDPDSA